jgi:DNA-binding PadR family transcriptional regulator
MPVKHGLLALLAQRDLTGYELKVRFERALGEFWQLNSGQVYSTLERLRRGALVMRHGDDTAVGRARYTLLPRGRRQLERWLSSPVLRLRPVRDPLYVKLVFTPLEQTATLLAALATETRKYTQATDTLAALVAREPLSFAGRTRWLVAEAARVEYEARLTWIESVRRVLGPHALQTEGAQPEPCATAPGAAPARCGPDGYCGNQRVRALRAALPSRERRALRG